MDALISNGVTLMALLVGATCFGLTVAIVTKQKNPLTVSFLCFYLSVTLLVGARLVVGLQLIQQWDLNSYWANIAQYIESFPGRYLTQITVVWFAHRITGRASKRWEAALFILIGFSFVGQHVSEYLMPKWIDHAGDLYEDLLSVAIWIYVFSHCVRHHKQLTDHRSLNRRMIIMLALAFPTVIYDNFVAPDLGFRTFPLVYAVFSVTLVLSLWQILQKQDDPFAMPYWWSSLTPREQEVATCLTKGMSNSQIADLLHISENTVKTHLKKIYAKSGVQSRVELAVAVQESQTNHLPG